jgi:hypothetical protein
MWAPPGKTRQGSFYEVLGNPDECQRDARYGDPSHAKT